MVEKRFPCLLFLTLIFGFVFEAKADDVVKHSFVVTGGFHQGKVGVAIFARGDERYFLPIGHPGPGFWIKSHLLNSVMFEEAKRAIVEDTN